MIAIVPFTFKDSDIKGGVLIDPNGIDSALWTLRDTYGKRLDEEVLAAWYRAQYGKAMPR
jgi:hypothetical protein